MHVEVQRIKRPGRGDHVPAVLNGQRVVFLQGLRDIVFMAAKMHGGPQFQMHDVLRGQQFIGDEDSVLAMHQLEALLDDDAFRLIAPARQPAFEAELADIMVRGRVVGGCRFLAADLQAAAIGQAESFRQMVEHHHAAQRSRQRRDQQAVVAA